MGLSEFAAIVRTTGARPGPLLDALQSLALQELPCVPLIVVHGDDEVFSFVKRTCSGVVLHASDTGRKRGYPVNVALDYCQAHLPEVKFLFLLDDDDIVYPFFTAMMAAAFSASEAAVVYAPANRREPGHAPAAGFDLEAYHHLFIENRIPSNSFAVRAAALCRAGLRMDEELDYLEDWHFLLRMIENGLRFQALPMTLSEFRIVPDSDLLYRRDAESWKRHLLKIRTYINRSSFRLPGPDLAQMSLACVQPASGSRVTDQALIASLRRRIWDLERSLSWRWMAPARYVAGVLQGIRARRRARA